MEYYEKKYRNALEIARKINNGEGVEAPQGYSALEAIFPELREEQLRKVDPEKPELKIIKDRWYVCIMEFKRGKETARVGNVYQSKKDGIIYNDHVIFIDNVDGVAADYFREWTIEDAAEGDLLVCYNPEPNKVQYGIFKYHNSSFDHDNITCFKASLGIAWDGKLIVNDYIGGSAVHPATIKQREQFKSSLENNIRNTINQKPQFNIGDTIIHIDSGGDYIHEPHKIVRVDLLSKKYYLEDGNSVNFSEQDDYELFV